MAKQFENKNNFKTFPPILKLLGLLAYLVAAILELRSMGKQKHKLFMEVSSDTKHSYHVKIAPHIWWLRRIQSIICIATMLNFWMKQKSHIIVENNTQKNISDKCGSNWSTGLWEKNWNVKVKRDDDGTTWWLHNDLSSRWSRLQKGISFFLLHWFLW